MSESLFPTLDEQLRAYLTGGMDVEALWDWVSDQMWDANPIRRQSRAFLVLTEMLDGAIPEELAKVELARLVLSDMLTDSPGRQRTAASFVSAPPEPVRQPVLELVA